MVAIFQMKETICVIVTGKEGTMFAVCGIGMTFAIISGGVSNGNLLP